MGSAAFLLCERCNSPFRVKPSRPTPYCSLVCRADFDAKWMPEPNSGCWLWDGGFYKSGYGYFYNGKVVQGAHRFSFEYFKRPLSLDENVCHSCDMPMCVNPDRLWAGTQADNMADKHLKGRAPLGEKHGGNKLTDEAVRIGRRENMSPSAFALRFHVNSSTAHSALRGKTWKHVK